MTKFHKCILLSLKCRSQTDILIRMWDWLFQYGNYFGNMTWTGPIIPGIFFQEICLFLRGKRPLLQEKKYFYWSKELFRDQYQFHKSGTFFPGNMFIFEGKCLFLWENVNLYRENVYFYSTGKASTNTIWYHNRYW